MNAGALIADDSLEVDSVKQSAVRPSGTFHRPIKKTIYTLNIGNFEPAICALTTPLMKHYAAKIGADFHVITERKFPEWPITYEKLQIFQLAAEHGNDWNIFMDADVLVNPECFDFTAHLNKNTVCHNGKDMASIRWSMDDPYFLRDGRWIGSCNWLAIASDWCLDLWRPLDDLTPAEALKRISITTNEFNSGQCHTEHLIDDFTLSRNIARFGLKHTTITDLCGTLGWKMPKISQTDRGPVAWGEQAASPFFFHLYAMPTEQKIQKMLDVLTGPLDRGGWALMTEGQLREYKQQWGVK